MNIKSERILDANINRVSEGLRVLEDIARFSDFNPQISKSLRLLRHSIRKDFYDSFKLLPSRDSLKDEGLNTSQKSDIDLKINGKDLIVANFKRVQEGLRVIGEISNIHSSDNNISKKIERYRFESYEHEKNFVSFLKKRENLLNVQTDIYCLTDENLSRGRSNIEVVKQMIDAGIKTIQYREKDKYTLYKFQECLEIRELTEKKGVTFIVNDDVSVAVAVKADGVHIGQEDLPISEVRKIVGNDMIIGLSTHGEDQAKKAVLDGADYIGAGPVYETKTKKDVCEPVGLEYIRFVNRNIDIPFVAIGGIKEHNIKEVKDWGASTFALVSEIVGAENIKEKIVKLKKLIN